MYLRPTLLITLPLIPFDIKEITGCTNEVAKGANEAQKNPPFCFLFYVLLFQ